MHVGGEKVCGGHCHPQLRIRFLRANERTIPRGARRRQRRKEDVFLATWRRERAHPFEGAHVRREGKEGEERCAVVPLPPVLPSDRRVWQSRRFSRRVRSVKRSSPVPLPSPFAIHPQMALGNKGRGITGEEEGGRPYNSITT